MRLIRVGRSGDHPRSRGVYASARASSASPLGSSPLARGLHPTPADGDGGLGIIPARAGFTSTPPSTPPPRPDNPRSRGVYSDPRSARPERQGSSPLARGLRSGSPTPCASRRIIPARAGFTPGSTRSTGRARDHPRSRGVYGFQAAVPTSGPGSSPLARGLRPRQQQRRQRPGIIPARAGFTGGGPGASARWPDHPRSRGVYANAFGTADAILGSSPLARGLP